MLIEKKITVLYNKISTNNKLKVKKKKKSLDKHGNTKQWLALTNLFLQTKTHGQIANDHIHVRTKLSNKSINHIVKTDLIHTNTKTHHICITYILLKTQHSH